MHTNGRTCDLPHGRAARAVVRVQVKSNRIDKPGHPMTRDLSLCPGHARELRHIGIELVNH
jgi:hypothetical protein